MTGQTINIVSDDKSVVAKGNYDIINDNSNNYDTMNASDYSYVNFNIGTGTGNVVYLSSHDTVTAGNGNVTIDFYSLVGGPTGPSYDTIMLGDGYNIIPNYS